jgi:hypothetical protein
MINVNLEEKQIRFHRKSSNVYIYDVSKLTVASTQVQEMICKRV